MMGVEVEHLTSQPSLQQKAAGQLEGEICATHTQTPDEHAVDLSARAEGQTMRLWFEGGAERALMYELVRDLAAPAAGVRSCTTDVLRVQTFLKPYAEHTGCKRARQEVRQAAGVQETGKMRAAQRDGSKRGSPEASETGSLQQLLEPAVSWSAAMGKTMSKDSFSQLARMQAARMRLRRRRALTVLSSPYSTCVRRLSMQTYGVKGLAFLLK